MYNASTLWQREEFLSLTSFCSKQENSYLLYLTALVTEAYDVTTLGRMFPKMLGLFTSRTQIERPCWAAPPAWVKGQRWGQQLRKHDGLGWPSLGESWSQAIHDHRYWLFNSLCVNKGSRSQQKAPDWQSLHNAYRILQTQEHHKINC